MNIQSRAWFNPNFDSRWFVLPGPDGAVHHIVAILLITALSVARERELGTFGQLLVTPLQPWKSSWERPFRRSASASSRRT